MKEIDRVNKYMVGACKDHVVIGKLPGVMTPEDAVNLAVWLVALAEDGDDAKASFDATYDAVMES